MMERRWANERKIPHISFSDGNDYRRFSFLPSPLPSAPRFLPKAHLVSAHTSELNQAVFHTENIAETFRSANGSFNGPSASFYDENWQECPEETAVYRISVRTADESTVKKIRISVSRQISDEIIYSVDVCKYPRLEAVYE